ncbi:restriction endonuclease subunit S [Aliarcobacter butzleri]|uniref:restriction endonuclease subunit S n=1 Tax=Aliarcobacter butzleri TaxID=28197 RepID=UPI00344EE0B4
MKYRIREQNELKPSGVEWLGNIPKDWSFSRLSYNVILLNGYAFSSIINHENGINIIKMSNLKNGKIVIKDNNQKFNYIDTLEKFLLKENDILIGLSGSIENFAIVKNKYLPAYLNQRVCALRIKSKILNHFIYYLIVSKYFKEQILMSITGSTIVNLSTESLERIKVLLPNLIEQQKIANFLDEKSKIFDETISKKEQLISKLELAKQSLISEVVTGKLKIVEENSKLQTIKREKNELKPSGVEWLGDIPKEWVLSRFDYETRIKARLGWKGLKAEEYVDEGYAFLATPNIKNKEIDFENVNYITKERYEESPEIMLEIGDVLLTKDGSTTGTVNVVRNLPKKTTVNSSIAVIRPKNINSIYLYYFIASNYMQDTINLMLGGMGVPHLFQGDLNKFKLLVPTIIEQQKISKYLDEKLIHFDNTIEKTKQSITKLKEAKEALISQAVTGKIEVIQEEEEAKSTNEYFKRRVLAAYFIDKLQDDLSFGRVKLQKMLYMAEAVNNLDFSSSYTRHAMGPHDPQMIRSIESQLKKAKWFEAKKIKNNNFEKVEYLALEKSKEYIKYLDGRYWKQENIEYIFNLMKGMKTLQTEIVATVYSAYIDLSKENRVSQDNLLDEILNHWHDNKRNVPKEKWIRAIEWMSEKQLIKI